MGLHAAVWVLSSWPINLQACDCAMFPPRTWLEIICRWGFSLTCFRVQVEHGRKDAPFTNLFLSSSSRESSCLTFVSCMTACHT